MTKSFWISSVAALALATPTVAHADIEVTVQKQDHKKNKKADRRGAQKAQAHNQRAAKAQRQKAQGRQQARAKQRQQAKASQQRADRRQAARAEQRQQARAQKRRAEQRQEARAQERRAEQRQQARAQERRAERRQEARAQQRKQARVQQQRADRRQAVRAEQRKQARAQERRVERRQAARAEQRRDARRASIAEQRRFRQQGDHRRAAIAAQRRAHQRAEAIADRRAAQRVQLRKIRQHDLKARQKAYKAAQKRIERRTLRRAAYRDWVRDRDRNRYRTYRDGDYRTRFVTVGSRISPDWYSRSVPYYYRSSYVDNRDYYYRYDNDLDYLYRVDRDRNRVRTIIPLGYRYGMIGERLPTYYQSGYAPNGYSRYYYDTPNNYYRTVGPAVYRMNPETQLLTAVVALLTGSNFNVGQMMPTGYNAYNVPMAYRDQYYDTPDSWYRYNNGSIYQVNPKTRMVTASYPLYEANYGVGQRWPTAYPDYNVPYGYQGMYYDTPDYDYRYAQGRIYQVDPKTQLITALASLVTGNDFSVGQPMPAGYDVYNVPYGYRDRFADSGDRWYRYSDGYVYGIDPSNRTITDSYAIYT